MITRRYQEPRGLHSDQAEYGFYVRLSGADRELTKRALEVATERLGCRSSNPMLLVEMMKVFTDGAEA